MTTNVRVCWPSSTKQESNVENRALPATDTHVANDEDHHNNNNDDHNDCYNDDNRHDPSITVGVYMPFIVLAVVVVVVVVVLVVAAAAGAAASLSFPSRLRIE
uniref:Transmembrane protein n=1 Tax=Glossina palpalis gambiensis TaxID=67801 RepID=A0A1B0AP83_9MUSC